ncbi:MAG: DNA gyrase inhibitor YacG [Bryobacterales bacterium]|nr:DNA gyrase inhibitor YacG [Bryobacterales bacterium]
MKCPQCKKPVSADAPFLPFCSERCKLLDLGDWASEKYVISTPMEHTPQREPDDEE